MITQLKYSLGGLVFLAAVIVGGWQLGWWFTAQNTTRQAELTQNGYSNQTTLRQQITAQLATVDQITTQIAAHPALAPSLRAQRMGVAGIVCGDAAEITGSPLPAQQAQWAAANCSDGVVSPSSTYYQAGQP
jgi:hypothetical protein